MPTQVVTDMPARHSSSGVIYIEEQVISAEMKVVKIRVCLPLCDIQSRVVSVMVSCLD